MTRDSVTRQPWQETGDQHVDVPVVLPSIVIHPNNGNGDTVTMVINARTVPRPIRKAELGRLLSHVLDHHGRPVRVEVHDPDGTVHADILTPARFTRPANTDTNPAGPSSPSTPQHPGLSADGFLPGEEVHLAVVATTHTADRVGALHVPLPKRPRRHRDRPIIIFGTQSATTTLYHPR